MSRFLTIAINAFMELLRQPVFLLLTTCSAAFEIFLATPYYCAFGDEPKLVKNSVLAVMLLSGLFGAVLGASSSLAREIRTGTALAVLSKPVGRARFLLAKYAGVALALAVMTYVNLVAALIASRMAFDAYGAVDMAALTVVAVAITAAYALAGFSNFFLRRPFVSDAFLALVTMLTLGAFVIFNFTRQIQTLNVWSRVDWQLVPASVLILLALWILAALAFACSTRLDMIPTLAVCSFLFMGGLMSDYLFGRRADPVWRYDLKAETTGERWSDSQKSLLKRVIEKYDRDRNGELDLGERDLISSQDKAILAQAGMGGAAWASVLYTVTPNWQLFWLADAVETGTSTFHWNYVGKSLLYAACYIGAVLAIAILLFDERELS
jgi:ABC-type transport system involved in multi-copper enzyme maturation permease subunit